MKGGVTPSRDVACSPGVALGGGVTGPGPGLGGGIGDGEVAQAAMNAATPSTAIALALGATRRRVDDRGEFMSNPVDPETDARDPRGARLGSPPSEPGLYVVATPIGNLRDITLRALDILAGVDRIYAEDTRVSRKLIDVYGLKARLSSYHEHNAESARAEILEALGAGQSVALISDAGTPLVSDPGFKLARAAIDAGHRVVPIPGASAPLAALVASGLPSDRFLFAGFAPAKEAARRAVFEELAELDATLMFFETGPRLAESLAEMASVFGARPAAVMRELTKLHEEARRGALDVLARHYANAGAPKGEIVVVIGPPLADAEVDDEALDAFLRTALLRGSVKEAAAAAHAALAVPRKRAYARALALKDGA
jgi:16S rRNA (cytidine1402-2'-O)-methyltransferase